MAIGNFKRTAASSALYGSLSGRGERAKAGPLFACAGDLGWRRGQLLAGVAQSAVDHHPHLLLGQGAIEALAIDEDLGRGLHSQRQRLLGRGAYLALILLGQAYVQLAEVEPGQRGLLAGDAVDFELGGCGSTVTS